jgi:hypothetical protein
MRRRRAATPPGSTAARPGSTGKHREGIFWVEFYFTCQHRPTIKTRAPAHLVSTSNNESFNIRTLLTRNRWKCFESANSDH